MRQKSGTYEMIPHNKYGAVKKDKKEICINYTLARAAGHKYLTKHPNHSVVIKLIMHNSLEDK